MIDSVLKKIENRKTSIQLAKSEKEDKKQLRQRHTIGTKYDHSG
jgi:hypothetical protein